MRPDREILREEWRVAAQSHIVADDAHQRAKEGKTIFLDELINELMAADHNLKHVIAERIARTSEAYKAEVERVHDLRRDSAKLKLIAKDLDRQYWESVSQEATDRAERKMVGYSR